MSERSRRYVELFLVAGATTILTMAAPAVAATVKHALFADNADKVDHKDAVSASASVAARKGKLVATSPRTGRLPNNIISKAPNAAKLGGKPPSAYALEAEVQALQSRVMRLENKLQPVSYDGATKVLTITGANLQIVDGTGDTGGTPNGLGNLIIGYNEDLGSPATRTGSHNLVLGRDNSYSRFGGIVAGQSNTISSDYASVTGGVDNTASGFGASVTGGAANKASDSYASVTGGSGNTASAFYSSVTGGFGNTASNTSASVSGGNGNTASLSYQWMAGSLDVKTATVSVPAAGGVEGNGTYSTAAQDVSCPAGETLLSGGAYWDLDPSGSPAVSDKELPLVLSRVNANADGWRVRAGNDTSADHTLTVQVLCYGP